MPTTQTHRANSPELDRPTCEQCGSRMWLRRIAHEGAGREFRTFECPVCEVSTGASDSLPSSCQVRPTDAR